MRKFEFVACVFKNCSFSTNIYSTFATHRHRKYSPHGSEDFKNKVIKKYPDHTVAPDESLFVKDEDDTEFLVKEPADLSQVIKERFGHLLLRLESTFNVPNKCINEIVDELQFISCCASSAPVLRDVVESTLKSHNCDLCIEVCRYWLDARNHQIRSTLLM